MNSRKISTIQQKCERLNDLDFILKLVNQNKSVLINGIPGMGKTMLRKTVMQKITEEMNRNTVFLQCLLNWTEDEFFGELFSLLDPSGEYRKKQHSSRNELGVSLFRKSMSVLIVDDFQYADFPETSGFLSLISDLEIQPVLVFSRTRPDGSRISGKIEKYHLSRLSFSETSEMICSLFQFQKKELPDNEITTRIIELSAGHPYSVKLICGLLLSGRVSFPEFKKDNIVNSRIEQYLNEMIFSRYQKSEYDVLKLLGVMRSGISADLIREEFSSAEKQINDLWKDCLIDIDAEGKIVLHDLLRKTFSESSEEISALHLKAGRIFSASENASVSDLEEAIYHYECAGQKMLAAEVLVLLCRKNHIFRDVYKDMSYMLERFLRDVSELSEELRFWLAVEKLKNVQTDEAETVTSMLGGCDRIMLEGLIAEQRGKKNLADEKYAEYLKCSDDWQMRLLIKIIMAENSLYNCDLAQAGMQFTELETDPDIAEQKILFAVFQSAKANFHMMKSEHDLCFQLLEKALVTFSEHKAFFRKTRVLSAMSRTLMVQGKIREAEIRCREVIEICRQRNDQLGLRNSCCTLGDILKTGERYEEAAEFYREALSICLEKTQNRAFILFRIAHCFLRTGNYEKVEQLIIEAEQIVSGMENLIVRFYVINIRCEYLISTGKICEAFKILSEAEKLSEADGFIPIVAYDYLYLYQKTAEILEKTEKIETIRKRIEKISSEIPEYELAEIKKSCRWIDSICKELPLIVTVTDRSGIRYLKKSEAEKLILTDKIELMVDFTSEKCFSDGKNTDLFRHPSSVDLLRVFLENKDYVVEPEKFYPLLYQREYEADHDEKAYRANVSKLRKLLDSTKLERFICRSSSGKGYSFDWHCNYMMIDWVWKR